MYDIALDYQCNSKRQYGVREEARGLPSDKD